jgi:hypothetical protein
MRGENGGYSLLYRQVQLHHHRPPSLEPLERGVILLLELPVDFVNRKNDPAAGSRVHLGPNRGKHVGRIVSKQVENAAGIEAVQRLSSLIHKLETTVIALDFGEMFDSDLQVVRHVAGGYVFTIEILDHEAGEKRPSTGE